MTALTIDDADKLRDLADLVERAARTADGARRTETDQLIADWLEDLSSRLIDAADLGRRIAGWLERNRSGGVSGT